MITSQEQESWNTISWQAVYDDDSIFKAVHDDETKNKYANIDRFRLKRFELLRNGKVFYKLFLNQGQRLIYRRRTLLHVGAKPNNLGQEISRDVVYLVGYQYTTEGKNYVVLNYIYNDGTIELDNSRNNLQLFDEER